MAGAVATPSAKLEADGAIAAQVFELFSQGKSPVEVVIETRLPPAVIEALYEAWQRLQVKDVTSTGARSRIDQLAGTVEGLRLQVAILNGSRHEKRLAQLAAAVRGMEARLATVGAQLDVAEPRESFNGLLGSMLEMNGRLVEAERKLGWCVQGVQILGRCRYA